MGVPRYYVNNALGNTIALTLGSGGRWLPFGSEKNRIALVGKTGINWRDLDFIRSEWSGPLILKGILDTEDAKQAAEVGADGIIVSNHGGRQLDGAVSAIRALPEVVAAVGDRAEVILDGGVRRGADVVKALCLGARACMIGRAWLYGLAAGGEAGVARSLTILRNEIDTAMTLLGRASLAELGPDSLTPVQP
jgi:L-lactate dehydrogenase (cytochrome)